MESGGGVAHGTTFQGDDRGIHNIECAAPACGVTTICERQIGQDSGGSTDMEDAARGIAIEGDQARALDDGITTDDDLSAGQRDGLRRGKSGRIEGDRLVTGNGVRIQHRLTQRAFTSVIGVDD